MLYGHFRKNDNELFLFIDKNKPDTYPSLFIPTKKYFEI